MCVKVPLAGFGVACAVHAEPFHTAATPTTLPLLYSPTPSQNFAEAHDTEFTAAFDGTVCNCHELPFHCSASVTPGFPALPLAHASQNVDEVHETVLNCSKLKSPAFGVDCRLQEVPFHVAASVILTPTVPSKYDPTASQKLADVHDTPVSSAPKELVGTGNGCHVHCSPSHVSAMAGRLNPVRGGIAQAVKGVICPAEPWPNGLGPAALRLLRMRSAARRLA